MGWGHDRDFWDYIGMLAELSHDTTTFTLSMSIESAAEFHRVACTLAAAYQMPDDPGLECSQVCIAVGTASLQLKVIKGVAFAILVKKTAHCKLWDCWSAAFGCSWFSFRFSRLAF